jgi:hypothetical protein
MNSNNRVGCIWRRSPYQNDIKGIVLRLTNVEQMMKLEITDETEGTKINYPHAIFSMWIVQHFAWN